MHIARILAGVVLGWAIAAAGAPDAHAERTLTIDDALALARANNRDLRAGRARLGEAEAGVALARAALMPTVSAQGKYTHNYKGVDLDIGEFIAPTTGLAETIRGSTPSAAEAAAVASFEQQTNAQLAAQAPIVIQKEEQLDGSVNASVPLVAPAAWFGYSSAKSSARSSEANYSATEASVLVAVAQAFYAAAGADELVVARTDAVAVANDTYAVSKARVESDLANPVDVTRAEAALVRAQQDLVEADNVRASAYRSLATLLGTRDAIKVAPPSEAAASAAVDPGQTADLVPHALSSRPELAAERATLDAANATANADAWKWSPTLSAFGNAHAYNYTGFSGDKYAWAVGLELDWVLYDGGTRDAQRRTADAQAEEARAQLSLLNDSISDEVANARGTLDTKHKAVESAQRSLALQRETLRLTRAQYDAGTVKQLDLLDAQDALVAAEVALAQAHFDVALADLQLRRAAGTFPNPAAAADSRVDSRGGSR